MTASENKLKVAIIGGGIAGLSLSVALIRLDKVDVQIYEAAPAFAEIGAGISLGLNALNCYKEIGIYDAYVSIADTDPSKGDTWFECRLADGKHDPKLFYTVTSTIGQASVHRADLLDVLVKLVPKEISHFGKHASSYTQKDNGVTIQFSDGTEAEADVVIGADGIKSTIRHVMYGGAAKDHQGNGLVTDPKWSGTIAYRGLIPMDKLKASIGDHMASRPQMYMGLDKHVLTFPIQQGKTVNVVAFVSNRSEGRNPEWHKKTWVEQEVPQEEMLNDYAGWIEPVQGVLQLIPKPSKWALTELEQLPTFVDGRVAIMGDAAHGMLPHQGNGASQAVEDAYIIAHLLSDPSIKPANVTTALKVYESSRKERAQRVQETSYEVGKVYELVSPCGDDPEKISEDLATRFGWIWDVDVKAELRKALQQLEEAIQST